jgi:uncharacterized cupin superfamily protein
MLGRTLGLVRTGVNIGRVPPGKESFVYHLHHREEEWIYVLAGKGIAEIDDQEFEVEPGDFMAFPTPSVAHTCAIRSQKTSSILLAARTSSTRLQTFQSSGKEWCVAAKRLTFTS